MEYWQLQQKQSLPLQAKVSMSIRRIEEWIDHWGIDNCYTSFSGGLDSGTLEDLVSKVSDKVTKVFVNTGLEFPSLVKRVMSFVDHPAEYNGVMVDGIKIREYYKDNVVILRPRMNFKQVLREYGYPIISKKNARFIRDLQNPTTNNEITRRMRLTGEMNNGKYTTVGKLSKKWLDTFFEVIDVDNVVIKSKANFKVSEKCCDIMKKEPFRAYEKLSGKVPFVGVMAEESRYRTQSYLKNGCNAFDLDKPQSRPLSFWTKQDVLQYTLENDLNYPKVYGQIIKSNGQYITTGEERTGCVYCGFGCHLEQGENRYQRLYRINPKLWEYCMYDLGFAEVLDFIGVEYKTTLKLFEYDLDQVISYK